eukprot:scaffold98295_cov41-Attheya_sp.AAC.1
MASAITRGGIKQRDKETVSRTRRGINRQKRTRNSNRIRIIKDESTFENVIQEILILELIEPFEYLIHIIGIERDFDELEQSLIADAFNQSYSLVRSNPTVMEVELISQEIIDDSTQTVLDNRYLKRGLQRRRSLIARFRGISLCRRCPRKRIRDPLFESRTKRRFLEWENYLDIAGLDSNPFLQEFNVIVLSGTESLVNTGKIPAMERIDTTVKLVDLTSTNALSTNSDNNTGLAITVTPTDGPTNLPTEPPTK